MIQTLLSLLAPDDCLVCGYEGSVLCLACRKAIPDTQSCCFLCMKSTSYHRTCDNCRAVSSIDTAIVATSYAHHTKAALHAYKYTNRRSVAKPLANLLYERSQSVAHDAVVTFVPTIGAHIRARGFDHARLLAREYAKQCGTASFPLLCRTQQTVQVGASRMTRLNNMQHAFIAINHKLFMGKTVILVDDVITTGATVISAAKTLKAAGAQNVIVVAVAQSFA